MLYEIKNLLKLRKRERGYRLLIRSLRIPKGAKIALTGPSGCGKSTTLDILGLSLCPDSADKFLFAPKDNSIQIMNLWEEKRQDTLTNLRLSHMGYVFQEGELLPFLKMGENVILTATLTGMDKANALAISKDLTEKLGINHLWNEYPANLSVGERQRAAIVRALSSKPQVILADEPTAALDPIHAEKVMAAFLSALDTVGTTLILVTHNKEWAMKGSLVEVPFIMEQDENGTVAILDNTQAKN